ncbi:MAG: FecR family protein [Pseudomonadota bacterium]
MTHTPTLQYSLLVLALSAVYPLSAAAAVSAGVAQFIAGDVNVRRPDGGTAPLAKGKDIESGESIVTGVNGRAQVRFTDGGLISLQPNTEFKIANYSDNAANPREERFLVDLLRGSMRAITGLIGKRNRENYKVTTTTATIGIRGSGFNVGYNADGSLGVTTELDAIEVCNAGGCVGLTAGESVRVVNSQDAPVRTNTRAAVPTPASPEQEPTVAGNKSNAEGKAEIVTITTTQKTDDKVVDPNTGTFTNLFVRASYGATAGGAATLTPASSTVVLDTGKVLSLTDGVYKFTPNSGGSSGYRGSMTTNDFVGWGVWITGTKTDTSTNPVNTFAADRLHYVVGQQTPLASMPTTAGILTYNLVGNTLPTRADGAVGSLTSTSFQVNFAGTMSVSIVTSFGTVSSSGLSRSGNTFQTTSGSVVGSFFGPIAATAGLVYKDFHSGPNLYYSGALVFQRP